MEYILLILVVILFTNKQYNDSRKKETYRKSNIYIYIKNIYLKKLPTKQILFTFCNKTHI